MSFAYVIPNERLELYIAIVNVSDLHLHEEVIPSCLERLAWAVKEDNRLKHPVIVDKVSLVVLDGMHRVAALERLRCKRIPACLVDYRNPNIKVRCWYRVIKGENALTRIASEIKQMNLRLEEVGALEDRDTISSFVAKIKGQGKTFVARSQSKDLKEIYDIVKSIEDKLRASGLEVRFETEQDALQGLQRNRVDAVILTPKLTKNVIVETALSGQVFSYKATRHIIPARPLYVNAPLDLLMSDQQPLPQMNRELGLILKERHLTYVPAGSLLDGRRYEEGLYIFEG